MDPGIQRAPLQDATENDVRPRFFVVLGRLIFWSLVRLDATLPEKMQQNPIYRVYHEQWPSTAGKSIKDMSC